jgi:hypothetical protein
MRLRRNAFTGFLAALINIPLWLVVVGIFLHLRADEDEPGQGVKSQTPAIEKQLESEIGKRADSVLVFPFAGVERRKQDAKTLESGATSATEKPFVRVTANTINGSGTLWHFRGSLVRLEAIGRVRRFYYVNPQGSPAKTGDMAFEGVRSGSIFSGRAFLFLDKCPPIPYYVKGAASPDGSAVKLKGKIPRTDPECRVLSHDDAELVFSADKLRASGDVR